MFLSAVSVLVVAQSSSEIPEGLMNNPVIRLIMRSSFVSALREEKLISAEIQHIIYSQSNSSSVAHSMFICPTAEKAYSSPQCQTISPSQYTIHYDTSHLSLTNVCVSPDINSFRKENIHHLIKQAAH